MTKIEKIIWDSISSVDNINEFEQGEHSKEQIFQNIKERLSDNSLLAICDDDLVFLFERETNYVARMHLHSNSKTGLKKRFYVSGQKVIKHFFDITEINKVWGMSPDQRFAKVVGKSGFWKNEGILTESHLNKNGEYVDQYIFGVTRKDCYEFMRKL